MGRPYEGTFLSTFLQGAPTLKVPSIQGDPRAGPGGMRTALIQIIILKMGIAIPTPLPNFVRFEWVHGRLEGREMV